MNRFPLIRYFATCLDKLKKSVLLQPLWGNLFHSKTLKNQGKVDALSYKTVSLNDKTVKKEWVVVDATDMVVGRLSTQVAMILRGKNKPSFTPHVDCGDNVIIINAGKIRFTGSNLADKVYVRHTGYPGGQRFASPKQVLNTHPERVLEMAEDKSVPLFERIRFLTIFASNLEEFYMVRVASLLSKLESNPNAINSAGFTPGELLEEISVRARELTLRHARLFKDQIVAELANEKIEIIHWDGLSDEERSHVSRIFSDRIFPVLTPLAVDPSHPFPYISGLSLNLAVIVKNPKTSEEYFARIKMLIDCILYNFGLT